MSKTSHSEDLKTKSDKNNDSAPGPELRLEPYLKFLFEKWWRVEFFGLDRVPKEGPCLIVGNQGCVLPWQALMLKYALARLLRPARPVTILAELDLIDDQNLVKTLKSLGFREWSSENMKTLFDQGEIVAVFPEGKIGAGLGLAKPFSSRYRLEEFDWTKLLPAIARGIEVLPLASYGFDEATPVIYDSKFLAKLARLPHFAITPFFPILPVPFNLITLPVSVSMNLMKSPQHEPVTGGPDEVEKAAKNVTLWIEGEIQAELNRRFRGRGS